MATVVSIAKTARWLFPGIVSDCICKKEPCEHGEADFVGIRNDIDRR